MDHEGLLGARENDFRGGKLGGKTPLDFQALIETEFIGAKTGSKGEREAA